MPLDIEDGVGALNDGADCFDVCVNDTGCMKALKVTFFLLEVWDIVIDFLFAAELIKRNSVAWGSVLAAVTGCTAILLILRLFGVPKAGYGYGAVMRVCLEDSTSIMILLTAYGVYEGSFIAQLNLYTSIAFCLFFLVGCLYLCGCSDDFEWDEEGWSLVAGLVISLVAGCTLVAAGIYVAKGQAPSEIFFYLSFTSYGIILFIGFCVCGATLHDGEFNGEKSGIVVGIVTIVVAVVAAILGVLLLMILALSGMAEAEGRRGEPAG